MWIHLCVVVQSLGRCIRHRKDYGAILLLDERLREGRFLNQLSRWVRAAVAQHTEFLEMLNTVKDFFHKAQEAFSTSESHGGEKCLKQRARDLADKEGEFTERRPVKEARNTKTIETLLMGKGEGACRAQGDSLEGVAACEGWISGRQSRSGQDHECLDTGA